VFDLLFALVFICVDFSANVVLAVPEQTADELSAPISTTPMLNVLTTPGHADDTHRDHSGCRNSTDIINLERPF